MTTQGALHLYGASKQETEKWIDALRNAISTSTGLSSDPLLSAAKRVPLETYDVHFRAAKGCESLNFEGSVSSAQFPTPFQSSYLGTSDHLSSRSRTVNAFFLTAM